MKRMIQLATLACFTLLCGVCFIGCSDDAIVETSSVEKTYQPFRLTASQETPSRLALGQDGLSVTWEPGDQLVLVKKDRSIVPIYMNAELDEPSTSATFVSETGVPAGEYWVIYNYNDDLAYPHHGFSSIEEINNNDKLVLWGELTVAENMTEASIVLQHLYAKVRVELQNLPTGTGMHHYHIGMYASQSGFPVNSLFTPSGITNADYVYDYDNNTHRYKASNRKYHNIRFGQYFVPESYDEQSGFYELDLNHKAETEKNAALILPADVSDGTLFFYILNGNVCYEIPKTNIKFEPGNSYKVILDMSTATITTLNGTDITLPGNLSSSFFYQLSSPEDCRHAAYRGDIFGRYILMNDIDFQGDTFLPFTARYLAGNDKSMKNITVDWSEEDYVGLIKYDTSFDEAGGLSNYSFSLNPMSQYCTVTDITLDNVIFKGCNYVGALSATNVKVDKCKIMGSSSIIGTGDYVGGLVGFSKFDCEDYNFTISNSSIVSATIKGKDYVGGIIGKYGTLNYGLYLDSSLRLLNSCSSAATVESTGNYVGGIFGNISSGYSEVNFTSDDYTFSLYGCVNTGKVTGKDYVGGIGGAFNLYSYSSLEDKIIILQSANEGDIVGANYVGGIVGTYQSSINLCYSLGDYSATGTNLGGIVGEYCGGGHSLNLTNCYSMANLTVGTGGYEGGIFGSMSTYMGALNIENCYFAGSSSTNSGIIGHNGGVTNISNCLTTLSSLGDTNPPFMDIDGDGISEVVTNTNNSLVNVTSILLNKSTINGDNAYSDNVWANYNYDCVKFAAGLSGSVVAPGFGTEIIY